MLDVAVLAQRLWDEQWTSAMESCFDVLELAKAHQFGRERRRLKRYTLTEVIGARASLQAGYRWPGYCWLPGGLLAAAMVAGSDVTGVLAQDAVEVSAQLFGVVATLAGWRHAPLIARFDADIAAALMATPTDRLPTGLLRRLPAPVLFVPAPWLGPDCGIFVTIDAVADKDRPVFDEVMITICQLGELALTIPLRLSEATITAALEASASDARNDPFQKADPDGANKTLLARYGRPMAEFTAETVSLLLYLTSSEPDIDTTRIDRSLAPRSTTTVSTVAVEVADVGFRLGSVLRASKTPKPPAQGAVGGDGEAGEAGPAERHGVTPHQRAAHCLQTYWTGPRESAERRLVLRWIHMIHVGADQAAITIRDVKT